LERGEGEEEEEAGGRRGEDLSVEGLSSSLSPPPCAVRERKGVLVRMRVQQGRWKGRGKRKEERGKEEKRKEREGL